jgi:hypothetical protein
MAEHGARIVANVESAWRDTILEFVEDSGLRADSVARGREYTMSRRMLQSAGQLDQWKDILRLAPKQSVTVPVAQASAKAGAFDR